jgi:hypothetical protein
MKFVSPLALLALTTSGPMSLAKTGRQCFERARTARLPRGEVTIGVGTGGRAAAGLELDFSSDYLAGKDPSAVYDACVMSKAGEPPSRPLYIRPDW